MPPTTYPQRHPMAILYLEPSPCSVIVFVCFCCRLFLSYFVELFWGRPRLRAVGVSVGQPHPGYEIRSQRLQEHTGQMHRKRFVCSLQWRRVFTSCRRMSTLWCCGHRPCSSKTWGWLSNIPREGRSYAWESILHLRFNSYESCLCSGHLRCCEKVHRYCWWKKSCTSW